jgi:hypothetical protein
LDGEYRLGEWHIEFGSDQSSPVVCDAENRPVATVHGAALAEQLRRALLIAKAPSLKEAAILALRSFRVIAGNDWGRASEAAGQLLPYFEAVLHGIDAEPA